MPVTAEAQLLSCKPFALQPSGRACPPHPRLGAPRAYLPRGLLLRRSSLLQIPDSTSEARFPCRTASVRRSVSFLRVCLSVPSSLSLSFQSICLFYPPICLSIHTNSSYLSCICLSVSLLSYLSACLDVSVPVSFLVSLPLPIFPNAAYFAFATLSLSLFLHQLPGSWSTPDSALRVAARAGRGSSRWGGSAEPACSQTDCKQHASKMIANSMHPN